MWKVPTSNQGTTNSQAIFDGTIYTLRTYWQKIARMWYLDLSSATNDPIAAGLALVPNINLLRYSQTLTSTVGQLRVQDLTGQGNATEDSLGNTAILYYFLPGEFESRDPNFNDQAYRALQFDINDLFTVV